MSNKFFEWYYIDIHQTNGYDLVFSLHTFPFMSQFEISLFDAFVYYNNRPVFHEFLVVPQHELGKQADALIEFSNSKLRLAFEDHHLQLQAKTKQFAIDLTLTGQIKTGLPLQLELPFASEKTFVWKLFMPLAQAEGTFSYFDAQSRSLKTLAIDGKGYFDSNNGNFNLKKQVKNWHWTKIYFKDRMWIAGRIACTNQRDFQLLVNCSGGRAELDKKATVEYSDQIIQINSAFGEQKLQLKQAWLLDDLYFLVATWPPILDFAGKIREVLAGIAVQKKSLNWLAKYLTNGRYLRKRWLAQTASGEPVEIFGEEMLLNG